MCTLRTAVSACIAFATGRRDHVHTRSSLCTHLPFSSLCREGRPAGAMPDPEVTQR